MIDAQNIWIGGPPAGPGRVAWARRVAAVRERLLVQARRKPLSKGLHENTTELGDSLRVVPRPVDLRETAVQTDYPVMKEGSAQTEPLVMMETSTQTQSPGMRECSSQTESPRITESSAQTESPRMSESSTQTEAQMEAATQTVLVIANKEEQTVQPQHEASNRTVPAHVSEVQNRIPSLTCMETEGCSDNPGGELSWDGDWDDWEASQPIPDDQPAEGGGDNSGEKLPSWDDDWDDWEKPEPSPDDQPAKGGLLGELTRRGISSLPWVEADPGVVSLRELGRGGYGVVELVDYGGELLVSKRFYRDDLLDEAYALCLLEGAGGTPVLRGVLKEPPTLFMTYCGCLTLEAFFQSRPERGRLLAVLVDLIQRVSEIHAKGLVHLDLKGENVMVRDTHTRIIDVGLAALPGQCVPFKNVDLRRVNWVCPHAARGGPVTYEADVFSLGRLLQQAQQLLLGQPVSGQLALLASQALAEDPLRRPVLATLAAALRRLTE